MVTLDSKLIKGKNKLHHLDLTEAKNSLSYFIYFYRFFVKIRSTIILP